MISHEFVHVLTQLVVLVDVCSSYYDGIGVEGVEGTFEQRGVETWHLLLTTHSLRGSQSNIDHSCDLAAIPSPEYDHPIGFSSQCDQVVLLVLRKSTRYKLLGLVLGLTFLISFKKRSPHLLVLDFVDCPDCTGCSLANGQEFLGGGDCKAG